MSPQPLRRLVVYCALLPMAVGVASAQRLVELTNEGPELFQHVAEIELGDYPALKPPAGVAYPIVTSTDGAPVTAQYVNAPQLGGARLLVLVAGLWGTGETRRLAVDWVKEGPAGPTDLTYSLADELALDNSYYGLTFPEAAASPFPREIRFSVSGTVERGFTFEDRLYDRQRGFFRPRADPERAGVPANGPLRVVVERHCRYVGADGQNPGGAEAAYWWICTAHSPIVRVEGYISRTGDLDFEWPEMHFLQISRADDRFPLWAGGDPLVQSTLGPESHSQPLADWGALYNGLDAVGMAIQGGLTFWDGTTEYVTYLQRSERWVGAELERVANVYIGPARDPERIRSALLLRPDIRVSVVEQAGEAGAATADVAAELANDKLRLQFTRGPDGTVGLGQIQSRPNGHCFVSGQADGKPLLWRLRFRRVGLEDITLASADAGECEVDQTGDGAAFRWRDLALGDERDAVDVEAQVRLPESSGTSFWQINVDNRSERYGLWEVHFPVIAGLSSRGKCDVAVPRSNWGILCRKQSDPVSGSYPSANWPFQMLTVNEGDDGLYLACHDPEAWPKAFYLAPGGEFRFSVWAANAGVPGSDFRTPGEVALGTYEGGWLTGCKQYRQWALASAPWTQEGKLSQRGSTPDSIKRIGLWMLGSGRREEIVPDMLEAQRFFGVPLGLHWYSWHEIAFDTHYPEYFPTKPGFAEGVRELTSRNMLAMPYINGRLHDMDIPSFAEAEPWCAKDEKGEDYLEVYASKARQAVMCPYTRFWQDRIAGVVDRLVNECGVNAVYLDQIAAAGPKLCFDKRHGHPLGGGSYWVDGYRDLLDRVQEVGHAGGHDVAFTTENNADPYMDGVDAFLIWNPRDPAEIPMMTAVYSGYTLYFSSPVSLAGGAQAFWMAQARDFLWGCQIGWMNPREFLDPGNRTFGEDLRRLGQYRVACRKFLTYGEFLGELPPTETVHTVRGRWNSRQGLRDAELPGILSAVWRAEDGSLGLLLANLAERPMRFRYRFDPSEFGGFEQKGRWLRLSRIAPEGVAPGGYMERSGAERVEFLGPKEVLVYDVAPVDKLPSSAAAPDRAAWDVWCLRHGIDWDVTVPAEVARGDSPRAAVALTNRGDARIEARCELVEADDREPRATAQTSVGAGQTRNLPLQSPGAVQHATELELRMALADGNSSVLLSAPVRVEVVDPIAVVVDLPEGGMRAGESSGARLVVTSHRAEPTDALIGVRTPPGWEVYPGDAVRIPALLPREERSVWLRFDVPTTQAATTLGIEAFVMETRTSAQTEVLPPRPRAEAARLPAPPTIDGALDEWKDIPAISLGAAEAGNIEGYGGPDDLSADVRLAWDDANLYVAATVTDQAFSQPHRDREIWQGDCIQLGVRGGLPPRTSTYDGVHEFGMALTPDGPELWKWFPAEGVADGGQVAVVRRDTQTIYEVAIPWSQSGTSPEPDIPSSLSFTANDDDGEGFRGWLEWASGVCGTKDAAEFGVLLLK